MTFRTRFAPSPTGPLHLGHAYSAKRAYDMAAAADGEFLLRIEDIDQGRARPEWEAQIYDDLAWLGLSWPQPVMRQSERRAAYDLVLDSLWSLGCLYPCSCRRSDISAVLSAPQEGVATLGPDGLIYPGTCRSAKNLRSSSRPRTDVVLRLDFQAALERISPQTPVDEQVFSFIETGAGPKGETACISFTGQDVISSVGDIVIARRNMGTSYHLAVVVDDAAQKISHVVRGADLFEATKIHVVLQRLLNLPTPHYHHHRLIRDNNNKRLAKRDDARAISQFRAEGMEPKEIYSLLDDCNLNLK
ncbi:tRNA glutamyl-Q(34) synthetase GluQRS [Sulfitobacter sp. F26204]|uniref:tRNA glutamyl-Q(34) synthetase GluQRS n=1 Tax=Sulfitobacter sp. F26204 TaxID=2996014 RepID=UPI00225DFEE7|nr:tRNA glutamyl-Q(34) synthetase GluQRS [Sulfitobacter sp. F26204]MCX7559909.1 tRNA glutamyl-Q(34) synthetase GluQRS [Sulfitobacter sp. F26204]